MHICGSYTIINILPTSTPFKVIIFGQQTESCECTKATNSSSLPVETNIESSEQLINTTNTHEDDNTNTCSVDSDNFSPSGTQDDFAKIAVDFRHFKKHVFVRGLVQYGRMAEIEIGDKQRYTQSDYKKI